MLWTPCWWRGVRGPTRVPVIGYTLRTSRVPRGGRPGGLGYLTVAWTLGLRAPLSAMHMRALDLVPVMVMDPDVNGKR